MCNQLSTAISNAASNVMPALVVLVGVLKESDYTKKHQHYLAKQGASVVPVRPRVWIRGLGVTLDSDVSFPGAKFLRVHSGGWWS